MKTKLTFLSKAVLIGAAGIFLCGPVQAKDLNTEIALLSGKLARKMVGRGVKKIAVIDFVDLQGRTTELGKYLAEQLSVEMVNEEDISVADRANIKSILAEHKLTMSGLVDPENAKKLGRFAGIDAIITGTVTMLDGKIILTVKAISTETAQIAAAAKSTFKSTSELQQLASRQTSSAPAASKSPPPSAPAKPAEKPAKTAGPLTVTVDSIRRTNNRARIFLTIGSQVSAPLEVANGFLIDSTGKEMQIAHSMRMDITAGNQNQMTVETIDSWNFSAADLKPPFDLSLEFGLSYGTMNAKTLPVSFRGLQ